MKGYWYWRGGLLRLSRKEMHPSKTTATTTRPTTTHCECSCVQLWKRRKCTRSQKLLSPCLASSKPSRFSLQLSMAGTLGLRKPALHLQTAKNSNVNPSDIHRKILWLACCPFRRLSTSAAFSAMRRPWLRKYQKTEGRTAGTKRTKWSKAQNSEAPQQQCRSS